jgi:molybdate transport system substrate-binding protein
LKYFVIGITALLLSTSSMAQLTVMISGGFSGPYQKMLPQFEKITGVTVTTLSGASQGSGPKTIKAQLDKGIGVDVVILSREGLTELIAAGKIIPGTDVDLATAPLGVAIPTGAAKPKISTVVELKQSLIDTKFIVVPGSTSGIYLVDELFPRLGLTNMISVKVTERGKEATTMLAAKAVGMAIQPTSELVNVAGIDYIGRLPNEVQLIQTFSAAVVTGSKESKSAQQLIQLLTSSQAAQAIQNSGLDLIQK